MSLWRAGTVFHQIRTVGEVSASALKRFSPSCFGSRVTTGGGLDRSPRDAAEVALEERLHLGGP